MLTATQGTALVMSDDDDFGLVNPPGMILVNLTDSDESEELEMVKNHSGGVINRSWINEAIKIKGSAFILPGYVKLKKGDPLETKVDKGDTAARKFLVDSITNQRNVGDRIKIDFEATWHASIESLIV